MTRGHGYVSSADLAGYHAVWREPLTGNWAGYRVITAPLPSSGGIALLSLLGMKADLAPAFAGVALNSPQYVHLLAEIEKRVFADRADYLGDPDFVNAPVAGAARTCLPGAARGGGEHAASHADRRGARRTCHAPQHHALLHHRCQRQRGLEHLHTER